MVIASPLSLAWLLLKMHSSIITINKCNWHWWWSSLYSEHFSLNFQLHVYGTIYRIWWSIRRTHDNIVIINHTVFHSNMAGQDWGALITYDNSSKQLHYVSLTAFSHAAQAGDDGGEIFIGHRGSTFSNNHAIDRGCAITIEIIGTTIDNSRAA